MPNLFSRHSGRGAAPPAFPATGPIRGPADLMVTLLPSFPHFARFARDSRLSGIRINSAALRIDDLMQELEILKKTSIHVPLYFDIKGRQLRIAEVHHHDTHIDITLNHPISLPDPQSEPIRVLFKAGKDSALLKSVEENGYRLIFEPAARYGPEFNVYVGESIVIRHPSLRILGSIFTDLEIEKMQRVREAGFTQYFLSYVEKLSDIWEFRGHIGRDSMVCLKIESQGGLRFAQEDFVREDNLRLVAARGDLYVEIEWAHDILKAQRLLIEKDPLAIAGSNLLLSVAKDPTPECADFSELAWLYDIGYRSFMLCDDICLKEEHLSVAINAFDKFRESYAH